MSALRCCVRSMADGIEIITGRERRRRWSVEDKIRVVAATYEPGACVKQVAASHDISPGLLFTWRRQARDGKLARSPATLFLPCAPLIPALPEVRNRARRLLRALRAGSRSSSAMAAGCVLTRMSGLRPSGG